MDYKNTLLLGKTDFEMRGNLNVKEPLLVKKWQDINLYEKMNKKNENCPEFALHDGPPYANGDIHCGTMLNKVLKDMVVRFKNMCGYHTPFVLGWDTHGLPIENCVTKSGVDRKTTPIVEFRKKCEEYALSQVAKQKDEFRRLGVLGEYNNPYISLNKEFEAVQVRTFATMATRGLIYKGLKPVYWSPSSESALAEAEIEYADVLSHSIYVAFKVRDGKNIVSDDARLVIWTTTPWTLPANLAISAHPDFIYGEYDTDKGKLVFLKEFEDNLKTEFALKTCKLLKTFKGKDLDGVVCKHPFYDRDSLVIVGTHVTNDAGTGLVHTAPGHGAEDYVVCLKYNIKPYCPVDEKGRLTKDTGPRLAGLFYEDANAEVLKILTEEGALLKHTTFTHSYPHDWRTHKPVIFRATQQWFCSIEPIREVLLKEIHDVKWYPNWGETRMVNMIKDRGDWCISRQRAWGLPIPIIYAEDGSPIMEEEVFEHIANLFHEYGSNIWYIKEAKDLLPEGYKNSHSPNDIYTKEKDIMDVWFDSGSSFAGCQIVRKLKYPVDLYLEGSDQFRGWFNSSLIVSTACYGHAPYHNVVTHGWVLDENGEQMHKSKGNAVDPLKFTNLYGADILRLWVATVDYQQDVRIGENLIKQTAEQYRKIRNTLKFISWSLSDYVPEKEANLSLIDKCIINRLYEVLNVYLNEFDHYSFSTALSEIMNFMSSDLSSFYFDISKDALYCDQKDSPRRKAKQYVLYTVGEALLRILNPVLPFTMDEFNLNMPGKREISPQLLNFPVVNKVDKELSATFNKILKVRSDILKEMEIKRTSGEIGSSQEAYLKVNIFNKDYASLLNKFSHDELQEIFGVSGLELTTIEEGNKYETSFVSVSHHTGVRCDRCRNYTDEVIDDGDGGHLCPRCKAVLGK